MCTFIYFILYYKQQDYIEQIIYEYVMYLGNKYMICSICIINNLLVILIHWWRFGKLTGAKSPQNISISIESPLAPPIC